MSRHAVRTDDGNLLEYGFDRAPFPGYFYSLEGENGVIEAGDTRSAMIMIPEEEHMNRSEIVEKLQEYGAKDEHIQAMAMDQQF